MIQPKTVHAKKLAEEAEKLYEEKLRPELESKHKGEIVVIDAESGDYFLGSTLQEANESARKKYPNNEVGYPAVYSFSSRLPISANL
jgi:hypothetical protein